MSSVEIIGSAFTIVILLVLLHLGKRRKHDKEYPMCVVFWCTYTNEMYVTPVRNLKAAQTYINKVNLTSVREPHITVMSITTHVLKQGVWENIP